MSSRIDILTFHRIMEKGKRYFVPPMALSLPTFSRLVETLAKKYRLVNLEEAMDGIKHGKLNGRAVAITFDDGYKDNVDLARDILKKAGVPATFFIPIDPIDKREPYWWDYLYDTVKRDIDTFLSWGQNIVLTPSLGRLFQGELASRNSVDVFCRQLVRCLNSLAYTIRQDFLNKLHAEFGPLEGDCLLMTWDEVNQLKVDGFAIGSHTISHRSLVGLPVNEAQAEIKDSREILLKKLGNGVSGFSYPRGDWNQTLAEIVARAGYAYAVTTRYGSNHKTIDVYSLARRNIADYQGVRAWMPINMYRLELSGFLDQILAPRRSE